jgi:NAD(P)-dependent dehydrogenase (short-subunit alcohol dehydrogenase family)
LLIPGDVRDSNFCEDAVQATVDGFGWIDILVNNAADQKHQESIEDASDEQFVRTFRTNIFGYFYMARATKGAIHALTKSLAQNLVDKGIRVNCVAPGPIWTPLNVADKPAPKAAKHGHDVPMKRPGQPEEVAPTYVFFASNADSSYITGEVLSLLGGETTAG